MGRRGDGIYLRGRTWWLDFRHEGTRHVARLGKGVKAHVARELAQVKRAAILKSEAGIGGPKRRDLAFEKAAEEFLAWAGANKRPKTVQSYRECLKQLMRSLAGKRLSEIHPFLIEKHKKLRVEEEAPVAANLELSTLKNLFNRCIDWGPYGGENPARKVRALKESKGRLRYLEPEEETRLLAAAKEPLRTIVLSGIYAGLRVRAEALTLRRVDVDLRRRPGFPHGAITVLAAYAKNGHTRTVPLNSLFREAFEKIMAESPGEYVFATRGGRPYRSIRSVFATACRQAGLKEVTPHTLRHTFASRLAMDGVDLRTIQELGGWSKLNMVQRYAHLSPSHKAEAVERIARRDFPTEITTPGSMPLAGRRVSIVG